MEILKRTTKNNRNSMRIYYLILAGSLVVSLNLLCCSFSKSNKKQCGIMPVSNEIYQRDKEQIANCFIDNVEYFRLFHRYDYDAVRDFDSIKSNYNGYYQKYPDAKWDPANFFEPYATRYSLVKDNYVNSPLPIKDQLKVTTDTIFYNKTGLICVAFLVMENKYSKIKGLEDDRDKGREFDARAMIGCRVSKDSLFKIYPLEKHKATGFRNYVEAANILEDLYCNHLNGIGSTGSVYEGLMFKQNVGDKEFFEKSPYFQKYDSVTYNFQMYRHLGKDFRFNYRYCK